jgi:hypothetical protein
LGDDRAETYLRLLAETELRRVLRQQGQAEQRPDRGSDPAGGRLPDAAFRPGSDIARSAAQVSWVGDVLVAAGVLANDRVSRIVAELDAALTARARSESPRRATRLSLALERIGTQRPGAPPGPHDAAQPMQVTPIGRKLRVAGERAPSELHLMTLVRTEASAAVTAAMRMHWPSDGHSRPVGQRPSRARPGTGRTRPGVARAVRRDPDRRRRDAVRSRGPDLGRGRESPARRGHRGAAAHGDWDPGFSWWVRDDDGNWHVGMPSYPHWRDCGQVAFQVRLTPPLGARPDTIEVAVTGPATRIRALVPVREAPGCRTLDT